MGVTAKIFEDLLWSAERRLGVDDPVGPVEAVLEGEPIGVAELERTVLVRLVDRSEELAPEQAGQNLHRQEVVAASGDPGSAVRCETATGDHTVQVWVEGEVLGPGVKDAG